MTNDLAELAEREVRAWKRAAGRQKKAGSASGEESCLIAANAIEQLLGKHAAALRARQSGEVK